MCIVASTFVDRSSSRILALGRGGGKGFSYDRLSTCSKALNEDEGVRKLGRNTTPSPTSID